jgi:hypothetical protein
MLGEVVMMVISLVLFFLFAGPRDQVSAQPTKTFQHPRTALQVESQAVQQLVRDLISFLRVHRRDRAEYELLLDVIAEGRQVGDHAQALRTLLWLHDAAECTNDRLLIRRELQTVAKGYLEQMRFSLEAVNQAIASTRMPGISSSAIALKNHFRRIEEIFRMVQNE